MYDVAIIGGGPAGLSAALNVTARGKTCAVLTNQARFSPLYKAPRVDNYSGMRGATGAAMLNTMWREAVEAGAEMLIGRVQSVMPMGDSFLISQGQTITEARRLILAIGAGAPAFFEGEERLLGKGVSYCATCDGMLYRGRHVAVAGDAPDKEEEVAFLRGIGVEVTEVQEFKSFVIQGEDAVSGVEVDGKTIPCEGVFLLRRVASPKTLLPGLIYTDDGRYIAVNRRMETNLPGVYTAGDCTGAPLQVAKAVGEGLVAAQNAVKG
ncbi:MAG: NAD(P)/FAD-dependent oxidoreductase [Oscillospiraceae bacterium]|nr:NAD(P)/FAD-dependent oxidoreductase [Oscillospiraceae bacterium]